MNDAQARGALEAILFVAGEAVQLEDLARALEMTVLECDGFIDRMAQQYLAEQRGVEIIRIEDKVQFRTSRQYAEQVQAALKPLSERTLSRSVLERFPSLHTSSLLPAVKLKASKAYRRITH